MPEGVARLRVEDVEVSIGITPEDDSASGGEDPTIGIAEIRERPFLRSGESVECLERTRRSLDGIRDVDASQEIVTCSIGLWRTREDVALVRGGHVKQSGIGVVRWSVPVGEPKCSRTDSGSGGVR